MRPLAAAFALLLSILLTPPACDTCGAPERCVYATLLLFVHDVETGDALPAAMVTQSGSPIGTDLTSVTCAAGQCTHAVSPGTGTVTISLAGYQDAFIDFTQRSDSCGAPTRQFFDIGMRALSEPASTAMVRGPDAGTSGCQ